MEINWRSCTLSEAGRVPTAFAVEDNKVGAPGRVELPTNGLGNRCSIHLSYGASFSSLLARISLQRQQFSACNASEGFHWTEFSSFPDSSPPLNILLPPGHPFSTPKCLARSMLCSFNHLQGPNIGTEVASYQSVHEGSP